MAETLYLRLEAAQAMGAAAALGKAFDDAGGKFGKLEGAMGRFGKSTGGLFVPESLAATKATDALGESHRRAAAHGDNHRLALNRISNSLEALSVEAVGANSKIASIATKFLEFGTGGVVTAGVLAGLAAVTFAWEKLGEETRKTKEETEKAIKVIEEMERQRRFGAGGKTSEAVAGLEGGLRAEQQKLDNLRASQAEAAVNTRLGIDPAVYADRIKTTKANIERLKKLIGEGEEAVSDIYKKSAQSNTATFTSSLAALITANKASVAQRKEAVNLLAQFNAELAQGVDANRQAELVEMISRLKTAMEGAAKAAKEFRAAWESSQMAGIIKSIDKLQARDFTYGRLNVGQVLKSNDEEIAYFQPQAARLPAGDTDMITKAQKYADDMRKIFERGWQDITSDGLRSWSKLFDEVGKLAIRARARMRDEEDTDSFKFKALGLASAGIAGGLTGYAVGQQLGSAGKGALGGAAAGAAAGSEFGPWGAAIGGLAGLATGLLGGAKAARERAEAEKQLQQQLYASIAQIKAQIGIITQLDAALASSHQQFDALRKQTEDALSGRKNEAERNRTLAELNSLEAQRAEQLRQEAAALEANAKENYAIRLLRAKGLTDEADTAALAASAAQELTEALKQHYDAATILALQEAQTAEAEKQRADQESAKQAKALEAARRKEDAELRLLKATDPSAYDEAARAAEERREIEDLLANKVDEGTIAIIKMAQAAEDVARATEKATAAMREQEDLDVRLLRAQGRTGEADDLAFAERQKRELEDAINAKKSQEFIDELRKILELEASNRRAQTGGGGLFNDAGTIGQFVDSNTVHRSVSSATVQQTDRLISEITTQRILQREMVRLLARIAGNTSALSDFGPTTNKALGKEYDNAVAYTGSALVS